MNSVDKLFDNNKKSRYEVKIFFTSGLSQLFENAVDIIYDDNLLAVVSERKIRYYRMKDIRELEVNKL